MNSLRTEYFRQNVLGRFDQAKCRRSLEIVYSVIRRKTAISLVVRLQLQSTSSRRGRLDSLPWIRSGEPLRVVGNWLVVERGSSQMRFAVKGEKRKRLERRLLPIFQDEEKAALSKRSLVLLDCTLIALCGIANQCLLLLFDTKT